MTRTGTKANLGRGVSYLVLGLVLLLGAACSGGSSGDSASSVGSSGGGDAVGPVSGTGSIAFDLELAAMPTAGGERQAAQNEFQCETDEYRIDAIVVQVFDENGALLVEDEFACEARQGTVTGVEAGDNRTVEVLAEEAERELTQEGQQGPSENTIFSAEVMDVTVNPGEVTDLGTVQLTPVNQAPVLNPIGPKEVKENEPLRFTVSATDPDGDALSFSALNRPAGSSFEDNGDNTATFGWTPGFDDAGEYTVTFTVRDDGTPSLSDFEDVTITVVDVPLAAPTNLTATKGTQSEAISLSWDDVANEEGYKIERGTEPDGPFSEIATTAVDTTTYDDPQACGGSIFYYRVRAFNAGGASDYSNTDSGFTLPCPPRAPTSLAATKGTQAERITLMWIGVANEEGYKIERAASQEGPFSEIATTPADTTTYDDPQSCGSSIFYYRVRAFNAGGDSDYSNTDSGFTNVCPPTGLTATKGDFPNRIALTWAGVADESGYSVERSESQGGPFSEIGTTPANVTTFNDPQPCSSMDYWYRVRAFRNGGNSEYSNTDRGFTTPCPPTDLTATKGTQTDSITLNWTGVENEDGYKIERSPDEEGPFTEIDTTAADVTTYDDPQDCGSTEFWYRVRAFKEGADSEYSNTDNGFTNLCPPTAFTASDGTTPDAITLSWADNSLNEDGYRIERADAEEGPFTEIDTTGPGMGGLMAYDDPQECGGTVFWYRVRAFNAVSESDYSNTDSGFTTLCPPENVSAVGGVGLVIVNWDLVPGAASYNIYWSTSDAVSSDDFEGSDSTVDPPFTITGLDNTTQYFCVVTAVNNVGVESDDSAPTSATTWFGTAVDSDGDVGQYSSIALDRNDEPNISYYDATTNNGNLKHATVSDGTPSTQTVDDGGMEADNVGKFTSIVVETSFSLDSRWISYYNESKGDLKLADDVEGFTTRTVDQGASNGSDDDVGQYTSIALDFDDQARISYYDATNQSLKHFEDSSPDVVEFVDSAGDVGRFSSIAVVIFQEVEFETPHIAYYDVTNGALKYTLFNFTTSSWDIFTVDTVGMSSTDIGQYTSIEALAVNGQASVDNVHVSYYDINDGVLKHALIIPEILNDPPAPYQITTEIITTVDSSADVGTYSSLALDSSGNAYISYYDATNGDLKYATNASGTWVVQTLDVGGPGNDDVGLFTSITLDAANEPHISYYDATNGDLRYATPTLDAGGNG